MRCVAGHSLRASCGGARVQRVPSDQRIAVGPLWLVDVARVLLSGSGFARFLRSSNARGSYKARSLWDLGAPYHWRHLFLRRYLPSFPPDPKWFVGSLRHGLGGLVVIFGSPMVFTLVSKSFMRNEASVTVARL